jgi:hypothetical protein
MLKHGAVTQSEVPAAETQSRSQMLKHGAVTQTEAPVAKTQSEVPVAETQSEAPGAATQNCHTVRSRQRLRHRAATKFRAADAETQRRPPEPTMLKHKEAVTVSGQGRHSQERNSCG